MTFDLIKVCYVSKYIAEQADAGFAFCIVGTAGHASGRSENFAWRNGPTRRKTG